MNLLSVEIKQLVEAIAETVEFPTGKNKVYSKVSNEALVEMGVANDLHDACEYLGIDFEATGHTFEVTFTREDSGNVSVSIYSPSVARFDGVPCILWGQVRKPLSEVETRVTFSKPDKYTILMCGEEGEDNTFDLAVRLVDRGTEPKVLNKALKAQDWSALGGLLALSFIKTPARECAKNTPLRVFSVQKDERYGGFVFELEGHGMVKGNTALKKGYTAILESIERKPENAKYPIYITFGDNYATTDGKQCVGASIRQDLPIMQSDVSKLLSFN